MLLWCDRQPLIVLATMLTTPVKESQQKNVAGLTKELQSSLMAGALLRDTGTALLLWWALLLGSQLLLLLSGLHKCVAVCQALLHDDLWLAYSSPWQSRPLESHRSATADQQPSLLQQSRSAAGPVTTHTARWYSCSTGLPFALSKTEPPLAIPVGVGKALQGPARHTNCIHSSLLAATV